ncbi:MAG: methyltransferase domain-containing protein [Candidatus Woesearchaeota archaeon]
MQISSLIIYSSKIYEIIKKSSEAPDIILKDLYLSKKYLGSKERKFINELVFTSLRLKDFIDFVVNQALKNLSISKNIDYETIYLYLDGIKFKNIARIFTTIAIEMNLYHHTSFESALKDIIKLNTKENIKDISDINYEIIKALKECCFEHETDAMEFWKNILFFIKKLSDESKHILESSKIDSDSIKILSTYYSMPEWILMKWLSNRYYTFDIKEVSKLSESFLQPAPISIRVNTHLISRNEVIDELNKHGINAHKGNLSPSSVIIEKRIALTGLNIYKKGLIDIQDEGSQLISYALGPKNGATVLDACAGAGGKALHIASIMNDSGKIIAYDINYEKIKEVKYRSQRQNFKSILPIFPQKNNKIGIYKSFDYVLIDAPCSGMGTIRRIPNPKWKLTEETLKRYTTRQLELLEMYSKYVKQGGVLLYSTCSSMFEENDEVIESFLNKNNEFYPESIPQILEQYNIQLLHREKEDYKLHVFTHKYGCDTFFICRLRKKM